MKKLYAIMLLYSVGIFASSNNDMIKACISRQVTCSNERFQMIVDFHVRESQDIVAFDKHSCVFKFLPNDQQPESVPVVQVAVKSVEEVNALSSTISLPCHQSDTAARDRWQKRTIKELMSHLGALVGYRKTAEKAHANTMSVLLYIGQIEQEKTELKERNSDITQTLRREMTTRTRAVERAALLELENEALRQKLKENSSSDSLLDSALDEFFKK